jgi:hypothetical protein
VCYTRYRKTLKGIAFFNIFVLLSRNSGVCEADQDEESGRDLHRAGVRCRSYRRLSVDQHDEPLRIGAELVKQRRAIDADNIHDARRE